MIALTFRCGCRESRQVGSVAARCPIHNDPVGSCFVASTAALRLLYGTAPELPPGGLFYPKIEGMKGFS